MGTTGTSVARRGSTSVGKAARSQWDEAQIETIRATVARDATEPELAMFLEICARYELDPFAKQVFFAKMPGRNGGQARVAIIVGRWLDVLTMALLRATRRRAGWPSLSHGLRPFRGVASLHVGP